VSTLQPEPCCRGINFLDEEETRSFSMLVDKDEEIALS